uniref:Protein SMAX1-LIKE 4 n=1 Tax=Elaeis guineensis var. tenera TaxID=51953 RepID=A0A6I9RWE8_ELAGV|nr:protein SMAX1-LIKE 4 [Elaeis guineensis]
MRTGACTVQQALTAEAASVLKLSLNLARRRGHAQVTPLHVAATLLSSSSSSSNLLRRACLKAHPHHPASHPLQCRALELCFNVALNRLPTTPPPSSSASLFHSQPSLSNALIAALKRAQAHQRRGCIELQQQQPQQQQQQPLLAIKVELEQLIISILDDPSVSRVMREAGFSSTCVKNNLEEGSSVLAHSSPPFFFESHKEILSQGSLWQSQFLKPPSEINAVYPSSQKEDLRVVLEVMIRKQGRRNNAVVVGDSVSITEGLVAEFMGRVERREVPDELKSARFIKLHLSYVHLRLMSREEVDMKVDDLRRRILSLASDRVGGGVIIYAGDLRWAVDEETKDGLGFRPVEHMIREMGRLLSELRSSNGNGGGAVTNKVWLLATASYQTYMRCQRRQPSLETQWALQAVVVPSGGLALSLQAQSGLDWRMTKLGQHPLQMLELKTFNSNEEEKKLICCAECASNFEKEASVFKSEKRDTSNGSNHLPIWLQPHKPDSHHEDALPELRRKWNRFCLSLHHGQHNQAHLYPPSFTQGFVGKSCTHASSYPWWSTSLPHNQNKSFVVSHSTSLPENAIYGSASFTPQIANGTGSWQERDASNNWPSEVSLNFVKKPANQEVRTTLALGSPLFSDSATSKNQRRGEMADPQELSRLLEENIPWQSGTIPSIIEALHDCRSSEKKGTWLLIEGNDHIGKRRLARIVAEIFCGSSDRLIHINMSTLGRGSSRTDIFTEASKKDQKHAVLVEGIDRAHPNSIKLIAEGIKNGFSRDAFGREAGLANGFYILTTSSSTKFDNADENPDGALKMRLSVEEANTPHDLKRRPERELPDKSKKSRTEESSLDLNLCAQEEEVDQRDNEEDGVPSDLTDETETGDPNLPYELLESMTTRFTMNASPDRFCRLSESLLLKLHQAFEEVVGSEEGTGQLCVDQMAVEELIIASGSFLESLLDKWVRQVFQMSLATVKKSGKVRLGVEGKEGNVWEFGFQGSVLPSRIHVD